MTEGRAELPGTRLAYWDTGGSGPAVVFLHAATGSAAFWVYQQPVLANAGYRVIGYARRGHGASDPVDPANPGIASDDLHHLMRFLGVARYHVVGVAAGGSFATDHALSYAEDLLSLTLVSTTMGIIDPEYVALAERIRPPSFYRLPPELQELGPSYRAGNPAGAAAWLALEQQSFAGPERVAQRRANLLTWAAVERIALPVLLIGGDADLWTPPSVLRLQASHLPHAVVHVVREAAHHAYWEQPRTFNRLLLAFLATACASVA